MNPIMIFFKFDDLPRELRQVSYEVSHLATTMDSLLNDGPEKTAGLRKLLEAKDCFVRARLCEDWRHTRETPDHEPTDL